DSSRRGGPTIGGRLPGGVGPGILGVVLALVLDSPHVLAGQVSTPLVSGGQDIAVETAQVHTVLETNPVADPGHAVDEHHTTLSALGHVTQIGSGDYLRPLFELSRGSSGLGHDPMLASSGGRGQCGSGSSD